ncbi:MAG: GNAT family N-acetyltransferase [Woeseia sp.]
MDRIRIRNARPPDAAIIADFNVRMAMETEGRPLEAALIGAGVTAVLDDPAKGRYWVAETNGEIVGQLLVTYEWSDWRNGVFWWIQSVYVRGDYRRKGVFSALHRHVESLARASEDVCGLRLYVERDNRRAQRTYLALGMTSPGYQVMEVDFRTKHIPRKP